MRKLSLLLCFLVFLTGALPLQASYRMQKIPFPYDLKFDQVKTVAGDSYLFLKAPCAILLVNSRQGALDALYWKNKLKEQFPSQNVYAIAGLAEMPGIIQKVTRETLTREPLVYFYDWKGSLNKQLFILEDPFDHIKLKPPGLTLLIINSQKKLQQAPIELNNNIFYKDVFKKILN